MKVIPVLNCPDVECVKKKIDIAKTFLSDGDMLHLDVSDGTFAPHKTWAEPLAWVALKSPFALEVHLMVEHPEECADDWLAAGARRLIIHAETVTPQSLHEIVSAAARYHAEVMTGIGDSLLEEKYFYFIAHHRHRDLSHHAASLERSTCFVFDSCLG